MPELSTEKLDDAALDRVVADVMVRAERLRARPKRPGAHAARRSRPAKAPNTDPRTETTMLDAPAERPNLNDVLAEIGGEVDELWDHVKVNQKRRNLDGMRKEAIQVAAMAVRFVRDVCDGHRGAK